MPSDLCNSIMAKAIGLIFSLFNITSDQEVLLPYHCRMANAMPLVIGCKSLTLRNLFKAAFGIHGLTYSICICIYSFLFDGRRGCS